MALDLARVTGFAIGATGSKPDSGSWVLGLPHEDVRFLPGRLVDRLGKLVSTTRPDLIALETFMAPAASKNQNATISQLMLHGALHAFASASRINVCWEGVGTIRKLVCGRATAGDSKSTKAMVLATMKLLGHLPKECSDTDRADAVAAWCWAAATRCGVRPALVLT